MTNTFSDKIEPRRARNTKEAAGEFEFIVEDLKHLKQRTSIVEYGCGFGAFAIDGIKWNLPQKVTANKYIEYIGIDVNTDYLFESEKEAKNCGFDENILFNKPKFILVQGTELEIGLNTTDIVFLVLTLHDITQIEHLADAFYNIFRILKPGGKLIIYDKSTRTESDEIKYILWEKDDFILLLKNLPEFKLKPFPNYSPEKKRFEILIKIIKTSDKIPDHNQLIELFISLFHYLEKKYSDLINGIEEEQLETGGKNARLEKIYKDIHSTVSGELIKLSKPKTSEIISLESINEINKLKKELIKSPKPPLVSSLVQGTTPGRIYNVPSLPSHYLNRPEFFDPIKSALILGAYQKVSISGMSTRYSLQGMGGIGKSVLASALAHDEGIRQSFQDGIIWITLGKKPDTITHQSQIAYIFEKDPPLFDNASQYKSYLSKILSDKCCLFVLDDVWRIKDTVNFDVLGPDSQMLITTRNENIVTGMGAENFGLDLLEPDQALELLRQASNIAKEKSIPDEAINIAKECGYLPLALSIIGSMLRNKPLNRWKIVLEL